MKKTITFEFEDGTERENEYIVQNCFELVYALQEFSNYLRGQWKHVDEDKWDNLEEIRSKLYEILNDHEVAGML